MWKQQPHLRTVVDFVARNCAQLGLHVFERVNETDRRRSRDNGFAQAIGDPGDGLTTYDLLFALFGDKLLYDRAYWFPYVDKDGIRRMRRLPPAWVSAKKRNAFNVEVFQVSMPGGTVDLPRERVIVFGGYSPTDPAGASPTVEALKETLAEQMEATKYRAQTWKRGGRVSAVIKRPQGAKWTDKQAERFREDWYANYTGDGPRAGGTPILEDGMELERIDFSAEQQQWAEGVKLSFASVASAFHVNPTMVGILEDANYSNVREFRRMLYGDTLGPYLAQAEAVINTFALRLCGTDPAVFYAEFNIAEKLQGSFEEQAAVLSTSVGGPWMLRSEARARLNLPAVEGMDQPIIPLNVLIGGQASPTDSGSQNTVPDSPPQERGYRLPVKALPRVKTRADATVEEKVAQHMRAFFKRQEAVVRSKLGSKADEEWWDEERWDGELTHDLLALSRLVTQQVAASTLKAIGFEPDVYDEEVTLAWLAEVARRSATSLNATTRDKIAAALADEDSPQEKLDNVFAAQESRAAQVATTTVTMLSGFAAVESTKQAVGEEKATKTWVAGSNPRASHAAMDGETVLLSEDFSNGAAWPGDGRALGAEDLADCNCELQINVP
jgi:HK97 family phage portal protein